MSEENTNEGGQANLLAPMEFDLTRREVPVTLHDPETGNLQEYVLVELDGTGRDQYLNNLGGRLKTNHEGKMAGLKSFDGLQANLLTRCMFEVDAQGARKPVTLKTVQAWPARVQTTLFRKAQEISALEEDSGEKEGND